MPRVLVAGKLHDSGLAILRAAPELELDYVEEITSAAMAPHLPTAEAVLLRTQPMTEEVIASAPGLRIVSRHGVGYDAVDVPALSRRGIPLTIVGDVNARTVAEHAMMLMLSASRRIIQYDAATRPGGDWNYRNALAGREISGKRLLIVGLGRIGRHLARMARGFEIEVLAHDPFFAGTPPEGVRLVPDLDAALPEVDLVSIHVPRTDAPILGPERLARLRPGAVIVNTARGGTVDEAALAAALAEGRLHGAGIDVFEEEPPAPDNPLLHSATAVLTPHAASMTLECAERMAMVAAQNIVDHFRGCLDPALVVNAREIGYGAGAGTETTQGGNG